MNYNSILLDAFQKVCARPPNEVTTKDILNGTAFIFDNLLKNDTIRIHPKDRDIIIRWIGMLIRYQPKDNLGYLEWKNEQIFK